MPNIERLRRLSGTWVGESSLWLRPDMQPLLSPTSATIYAVAGDRVLSLDYAWVYDGNSQDGRLLLAPDDTEGVHIAWCDSFHMDASIMDLRAGPDAAATSQVLRAVGTYRVDDSEPWGWRIELDVQGPDAFQLRMFNLLPASMGSLEALAVRADYTRA